MSMNEERITRRQAAEILGISYMQLQQYITKGKLTDLQSTKKQRLRTVYLSEVMKLKSQREERAKKVNMKRAAGQTAGSKFYYTGIPCPHNLRIIIDPTDDSGFLHYYIVTRKVYDDLNTGVRTFDELDIKEILYEYVGKSIMEFKGE